MKALNGSSAASVSIVLVNYKTVRLTKLCLSLLYSRLNSRIVEVIVVDNDSADESVDYLRSLSWIRLIERKVPSKEPPHIAHAQALDLALVACQGDYLLALHTDTLIHNMGILDLMLESILCQPNAVAVGCVDQRYRSLPQRLWRRAKNQIKSHGMGRSGSGSPYQHDSALQKDSYLKSFCCLWDVKALRELQLRFCHGGRNPGYSMQDKLRESGFTLVHLRTKEVFSFLSHVQSGTHAEMGVHEKDHRRVRALEELIGRYSQNTIE